MISCFFSLLVFGPLFLFVGSFGENCLTFAVRKRITQGGTLLIRRATFAQQILPPEQRNGVGFWLASHVPHFLWADAQGVIWSYTNKPHVSDQRRAKGLLWSWLNLWSYDGHVKQGDEVFGEQLQPGESWLRWESEQ